MTSLIPTVDDLAADPVTHLYDDMIAPAGLTNMLGTVRVDHDLTALSAVQFPPVSQGLTQTAALFVDGRLFASYGVPVTHEWRPDRVVRRAVLGDLTIETTTVCVPGRTAVAIDIAVSNAGPARSVAIGLSAAARVTRSADAWLDAESPSQTDAATVADGTIEFSSPDSAAWSIQGIVGGEAALSGVAALPAELEVGIGGNGRGGDLTVVLDLPAGGTTRTGYVQAIGTAEDAARRTFTELAADVPGTVVAAEEFWNRQLEAAFTPGSGEFSGALPVLETASEPLRKIYWWAALGVIWFRRDWEGNILGRSYDTLMPNYWGTTTFIWDYSLSSLSHALLDPAEMRRQLLHWISLDIHSHFGTSSVTGGPVGRWYSVNDYAMIRLVHDYVRLTGDIAFLSERVADTTVGASVREWATAWKALRNDTELADYGEIDNLLECVSSYTHEVAGLNAANVWNMRTAASIVELEGDESTAAELRRSAEELLPSVIARYLPGEGIFAAGQPDGTLLPVRHCYDFSVVGTTIADDLAPEVRAEMVDFFQRELQTENWLRALSPWDPDASYSVRPDHQWNGAYPAWPADAGRALAALGAPEVLTDWIEGLAKTANQGPMGQAHFVEEAVPGINGGARKAPPQLPYIIDWACSSAGAWTELVIEALFGVSVALDGTVTAAGSVAALDPTAVLRGLRVGDASYDIHADGRVAPAATQPV
ncbi:hypothetical protein HD600_001359 [Microbacterium ginsengiterrae]|uniref:Alpha-L-rhamnosidase six-hairpin glycosidase domain-containing protein n=1 Tax=Microbacterium ginsengiterrae TaxID=546115 RepID=A0A7W9CCQ2_9MICO|nr:hypothetical protein [Microbacterium ginsengiterrae]MBB5742862.1 hypothetical protein [Microbacterium ginsengiterrae]